MPSNISRIFKLFSQPFLGSANDLTIIAKPRIKDFLKILTVPTPSDIDEIS